MKYETGFIVKVLPNCFQFQLSESTQLPSFFILLNRSSLRVIGLFLCSNIAAILGVLSSSCLLEAQVGCSIEVRHKCAFKMFLLRFSETCEFSSSKATLAIAFFAAVNHNYDHKERTLKHKNTLNGSKSTNHKSQTLTF